MAWWFASSIARAACSAESGPATGALVELYTSGRCPECPAAERRLSELRARHPGLIAVSVRVGDSGYAGGRLSPRQRMALLHRPHLLLQGGEADLEEVESSIARVTAQPARARLALELTAAAVQVQAEAVDGELYLGVYEGTQVGEWMGPLPVRGRLVERRLLAPKTGVIAFIQDRRTRAVLQALRLSAC